MSSALSIKHIGPSWWCHCTLSPFQYSLFVLSGLRSFTSASFTEYFPSFSRNRVNCSRGLLYVARSAECFTVDGVIDSRWDDGQCGDGERGEGQCGLVVAMWSDWSGCAECFVCPVHCNQNGLDHVEPVHLLFIK